MRETTDDKAGKNTDPRSSTVKHARVPSPVQTDQPAGIARVQRLAGNKAVSSLISAQRSSQVQRQKRPAPSIEKRVSTLEKKNAAKDQDDKWRSTFTLRLSTYRQSIYHLTAGFETAMKNFNDAHAREAAAEALRDQVFFSIINVGAAGIAQPLLSQTLGRLGPLWKDKVVELIENPLIQAAQSVTAVKAQQNSNTRAGNTPGTPGPAGAGDPLTFLAQNLGEVETQVQGVERAFITRHEKLGNLSDDDWDKWSPTAQESEYQKALSTIDQIALSDADQLESPATLATKIELYFWAAWIKTHIPGVKGLQVHKELATRMKAVGLESLAPGVKFDTTSWIFMNHQPEPPGFDNSLHDWANKYDMKLTK
jgi:hypothetical protein